MEYRRLGSTGLKVSALSYGAWVTFGNQIGVPEGCWRNTATWIIIGDYDVQAKEILSACREAGVNFFDNAEVYAHGRAEEVMGQAIKELGWKRSDLVLSTKIFWGPGQGPNDKGLSRKHIIEGTKASLQRMQVDYVDLLFCHRPDPETPIQETVRAMNWVVDQGWALYWGTSEWNAAQIEEAWHWADKLGLMGPAMEQPQYNIFERNRVEIEYKQLYKQRGLGLTTWSPLASGVLTGKYCDGALPDGSRFTVEQYKHIGESKRASGQIEKANKLLPLAQELGCSLAQLALAWCLKNKNVSTVITGATKVHQVQENMKALQVVTRLTDELMSRIDAIAL